MCTRRSACDWGGVLGAFLGAADSLIPLFAFDSPAAAAEWQAVNDGVLVSGGCVHAQGRVEAPGPFLLEVGSVHVLRAGG